MRAIKEPEYRRIIWNKVELYIREHPEFNFSYLDNYKRRKTKESIIDNIVLCINIELNLIAEEKLKNIYKDDLKSLGEAGIYSDKWFGRFLEMKPDMIEYLNNKGNQMAIEKMISDVLNVI